MKQAILNTIFGHYALRARAKWELILAAANKPEAVGHLANDYLGEHLVTRLVDPDKIFVDIGAHIGSIVSEVLHHNRNLRVIAIEAIPAKAEKLRRKFKTIEVMECAVGAEPGQVAFFINTVASGYSSLSRPASSGANVEEIIVQMKTLDEIIPETGVDVIKMDVEGAELQVLLGGRNVIGSNMPVIYFESGPGDDTEDKNAIWELLQSMGYRVLLPNRLAHNDEEGLSQSGFLESHLYPRRTTNYFAVPLQRRIEIRDRARKILGI